MHVGMATGFAHQRGDGYPDARFIREEFEDCVLAEELGFDSVWITEHHFDDYSIAPDPLMYLSYLAGRTKRIRLGTQVLVVPWHDPVRVAEQILVLDHASGGRALLGFGRGLARREYEGLRIPQHEARERFDEILHLVIGALETGFIEGGEIFKQPRRELRPRPLKSFQGRMFHGGNTPASLVTAAKYGMGRLILTLPQGSTVSPADVYAETWREVHGAKSAPPKLFLSGLLCVDESSDRAVEIARKHAANTFRAAVRHYEMTADHFGTVKGYEQYIRMKVAEEDIEKTAASFSVNVIAGTPAQVLEKYEGMIKHFDPQGLFPHLYFGGMDNGEATRNMRLFAKTCLPELKSWPIPTSFD